MTRAKRSKEMKFNLPPGMRELPHGLYGYWWESTDMVCVPLVIPDHPGDGTFSAFLNYIEAMGKTVFFPTVIGDKLYSILTVRGYVPALITHVDGLALIRNGKK